MTTIAQDLRFALRSLLKRPAFTLVAVLSLGLGIGANTAIFSVINAVLVRPLPYTDASRLVDLYESSEHMPQGSISPAAFSDWRTQNHAFSQLAAYRSSNVNLQDVSTPERLSVELTSANMFSLLDVRAARGRTFAPGEDRQTAPHVAVLSDALWRRSFGASPAVVGRTIQLSGEAYTVIGVMPRDFRFPANEMHDLWMPLQLTPEQATDRSSRWLRVIGRLKPGVQLSSVNANMSQIAARLEKTYPVDQKGLGVLAVPLRDDLTSTVRPALMVLLGASGLVLLIACANVANLLLARASDRRREVAIRLALGAGRARLVRQFLTESVLLGLGGGLLGLFIAVTGAGTLITLAGTSLPRASDVGFDPRVFTFLLIVAVTTGVVSGMVPALQATRIDLQSDLKDGGKEGAGRDRRRFRGALVIAETALALVLLVGAALLMRTLATLENTATGMTTRDVLTMHLSVPPQQYDSTASARFFQPVLERVKAIPGVRAAGVITALPLQDSYNYGPVVIEGGAPTSAGGHAIAENRIVSPGYFGALGIRIRRGRNFADGGETGGAVPEVVVNEAFARAFFPHSDPIGHKLRLGPTVTAPIVGIVSDVRETQIDRPSEPTVFFSFLQYQPHDMVLVISTAVPPRSVTAAVRGAIRAVDPEQPVYRVQTMDAVVADSISSNRFSFWLLGTFATIALALAAAGIYGVMSYIVTQRTHEIGVRQALGARRGSIVSLIVRYGMTLTAAGLAIGIVLALLLTRVLESAFYESASADPTTLAAGALLLATVALIASYVPARRAAAVEPVIALRHE